MIATTDGQVLSVTSKHVLSYVDLMLIVSYEAQVTHVSIKQRQRPQRFKRVLPAPLPNLLMLAMPTTSSMLWKNDNACKHMYVSTAFVIKELWSADVMMARLAFSASTGVASTVGTEANVRFSRMGPNSVNVLEHGRQ